MRTLNRLPQAILFDNDGVLIASEPLHWSAWNELLSQLKIPYIESEIRGWVGKTAPEIMVMLLDKHRPGWSKQQFDPHALALQKNDIYLKLAHSQLQAYPGVREGLQWLKEVGIKTAVVSNAKSRELRASLDLLGLRSFFDEVISRDQVPAPKPDPAPYLLAAASLGIERQNCIAVEDSPPGIEAALMGKIPAVAILSTFTQKEMGQPVLGRPDLQPVAIFNKIAELFESLKSLHYSQQP